MGKIIKIPRNRATVVSCGDIITPIGIVYNRPLLTYQPASYRIGDSLSNDINYPYNSPPVNPKVVQTLVNLYTLGSDNEFGNRFRFTDQIGNKGINENVAITADILTFNTLIDHYTGLEWGVNDCQLGNNKTWNVAIDECLALNVQGFNDWYLPSVKELESMMSFSRTNLKHYMLFTLGNRALWSSDTDIVDSTKAIYANVTTLSSGFVWTAFKTANFNYYPVRKRY